MGTVGCSLTSGESVWITEAVSDNDQGELALAPNTPGEVLPLDLDPAHTASMTDTF